jgi:hypothetical protein
MSTNKDILAFIENNFNLNSISNNILKTDINNAIANNQNQICYIPSVNQAILINGLDNSTGTIDFSYLIPNLFRLCYANNTVKVPDICNRFIFGSTVSNFFPVLLEENLIKSFLYFNFPMNIEYYNNNFSFMYNIIFMNQVLLKKIKNSTYHSYSTPVDIVNELYSSHSILINLVKFINYIKESYSITNNNEVINPFYLTWEFNELCLCYSGNISNTYIVGNTNNHTVLSNSYASLIYNIQNNLQNTSIGRNSEVYNNSIFTIIQYVKEVFEDVIMKIQYTLHNIDYCDKEYMKISNIPVLVKLYNNFYNNQIYTNGKALPNNSVINIIPQTITINQYVANFINIYNSTKSDTIYLDKTVILNASEALVIYSNVNFTLNTLPTKDPIEYYYYYINITNPSAIELTNIANVTENNIVPNTQNLTAIDLFVKSFNNLYKDAGYKPFQTNYYNIYNTPPLGGGLYPNGGNPPVNPDPTIDINNIGYTYNYYNSDNILTYKIYLCVASRYHEFKAPIDLNSATGIGLIYYRGF